MHSQILPIHVKPMGSKTWKYTNIKGEISINCDYPVSYPFSPVGFAVVAYPRKNMYILINSKGEEIKTQITKFYLKDIFGYKANGFSDGLITVREDKKWGCLDTLGCIAIPLKYDELSVFSNGYGIGKIKEELFVVSSRGKETLIKNRDIDVIKQFRENLAPFVSNNGLVGFLDTTGVIAIPANFMSAGYFCNGMAWVKNTKGMFGYINNVGEWVIQPVFIGAKDFDKESGMALVKKGEEWLFINEKGETFSFGISDITDDFHEGLARGKKGYYFGFYNNKGEWIIQPQFEGLRDFKNGYAAAKANNLWGIIDKSGNWVIKPTFAAIKDVEKRIR